MGYMLWSGAGTSTRSTVGSPNEQWQDWSLFNTARVEAESVPHNLVFNGTCAPTEAVNMLNNDRTLWPNLFGECYVWSSFKGAWYRMCPGRVGKPLCKMFVKGYCANGARCTHSHSAKTTAR